LTVIVSTSIWLMPESYCSRCPTSYGVQRLRDDVPVMCDRRHILSLPVNVIGITFYLYLGAIAARAMRPRRDHAIIEEIGDIAREQQPPSGGR